MLFPWILCLKDNEDDEICLSLSCLVIIIVRIQYARNRCQQNFHVAWTSTVSIYKHLKGPSDCANLQNRYSKD